MQVVFVVGLALLLIGLFRTSQLWFVALPVGAGMLIFCWVKSARESGAAKGEGGKK